MITLDRFHQANSVIDYTVGRMVVDTTFNSFQCFTLEPAWLNNLTDVSCAPPGTYPYVFRDSPKNGHVLELVGVPARTNIQVHAGSFRRNSKGCILVGRGLTFIDSDDRPDLYDSKKTLTKLLCVAGTSGFITIR